MHGTPDDPAQLRRILSNDSSRFLPLDSHVVHVPGNSWSGARFLRWNSDSGPMILKIWPTDGPEIAAQRFRHHSLEPLRNFTPVPALPIPDANGRTLRILEDGRCAELFRWLEGDPVGQDPPDETIRQVMTTLARLHRLWSANFGQREQISDAVRRRIVQLNELASGGIDDAANELLRPNPTGQDMRSKLLAIIELARKLLPQAVRTLEPLASQRLPLQIVLRDTRPNHFLTRDENVVGLIDFGAIGFDSVALDLARLFGEWPQIDRRKRDLAFRSYESVRPLNPAEMAAIEPLITSAAILGGVAWVDIVCRRRMSEGRETAAISAITHAEIRLKILLEKYLHTL